MFAVVSKSEKMPVSCWGRYRKVAVVELNPDFTADDVTMISKRARAVKRVVAEWERLNVGYTTRCAYEVALAEAREMCERLNSSD